MAYYEIPLTSGTPQFVQQASLDGVVYTLDFYYNTREDSWYFNLLDVERNPIIMGRKMVADWPLLQRSRSASKPPGELYVIDNSGAGLDPSLDDFGDRVSLVYADEAEFA
jgi:hypothetical protein